GRGRCRAGGVEQLYRGRRGLQSLRGNRSIGVTEETVTFLRCERDRSLQLLGTSHSTARHCGRSIWIEMLYEVYGFPPTWTSGTHQSHQSPRYAVTAIGSRSTVHPPDRSSP